MQYIETISEASESFIVCKCNKRIIKNSRVTKKSRLTLKVNDKSCIEGFCDTNILRCNLHKSEVL